MTAENHPSDTHKKAINKKPPALHLTIAVLVGTFGFCLPVVVMMIPRPVLPESPPKLVIRARSFESIRQNDERIGRTPLPDVDAESAVTALKDLYERQGTAEYEASNSETDAKDRDAQRKLAILRAPTAYRERIVERVCAAAVTEFERVARSDIRKAPVELVGTFPDVLARYGVYSKGKPKAPSEVVRTLFKARCYAVFGQSLTLNFKPPELIAYHGWLALEAGNAPLEKRMEALDAYGRAGGLHVATARAFLLVKGGFYEQASELYKQAFRETGQLWLRNYALGALAALTETIKLPK